MNLKFNTKLLNKVIAVITVCFFTTTICMDAIAIAVTPETKVLEYKQISNDFSLPYSYGKITKAHFAATDRVIINIQDLHCHPQVQKNISNIIELFDKNYGISNVYLEGAYGDVSTKWLIENIKDDRDKTEILNKILETGKLTGAEYYSAISDKTEIIKGLEKKEPYLDNLKRFGDLLEKQDEIKLILNSIEKETEKIKKQYYKRSQLRLEKLLRKYEQGKISTDKHYNLLSKYTNELAIDLAKYKNISNYITLLKLQKQFNRKTVQKELTNLLSVLKQKMSYQMYSMLLLETDNLKRIDILFEYITQMLQSYNINLADNFSQLDKYFQFIKINKNINPIQLLKEQEQLVMEMNLKFCENKLQREVVFLVSFEKYLKQYLITKITSDDYEYYKENIDMYKKLYNKYVDNKVLTLLEPYMKETDKFYEININRNEYFAENIFNGIETNKLEEIKDGKDETNKIINNMSKSQRIDVIVTGGFHSQTVTDILKKQGVSYIVITPNIQGEVKEAEQTYYEIAKQQKDIDFQTLATLPLSSYNKTNYRVAVAIKAFPKEAEKIFGKEEIERVKNLIEKSYINISNEDIKNTRKYKEELERNINISKMLESDDIDLEDLKNLIKIIGDLIFDVEDLSEQELFNISKDIVELMNNKDSNLVVNFFNGLNELRFDQNFIFFRIFKSDKTQNVKKAIEIFLELTNYDFSKLQELFDYSDIKGTELQKLLVLLLEKDSKGNYQNKKFIEQNIDLIIAICSAYKQEQAGYLETVLNIVLKEEYKELINNNIDIVTTIIEQKYIPQDLEKILNFLLEKNKEDIAFIDEHSQLYGFYGKSAIATIIKQGYDIEYLEKILNKLLEKDKDDNYIYENLLNNASSSLLRYLMIFSPISKEMLDFLIEYEYVVDNDFDLVTGLFEGLQQLSQTEKRAVCYKLIDIFEKYCKEHNFIDDDMFRIRNFLINNISPDISKRFGHLIVSELKSFQYKSLDEYNLSNKNKLIGFIINNINTLEQLGLTKEIFSLLIDDLKILQKAPINKNAIECEDNLLSFLIENYYKLNINQKESFNNILNNYISEFIDLTDNYNDKEVSQYTHHSKSFFGMIVTDKGLEKLNKQQEYEKLQEEREMQLTQKVKSIINNRNKFGLNISADKLKIIEKKLNIISKERDFERLNNKVKKMFMEEYIQYPVTLKEYSIDTSIEIDTRIGKNPPLIRNKEEAKKRNYNNAKQVGELFTGFAANRRNNNEENNKIFKEKTGFTIDEIKNNFIYGEKVVKNEGESVYERDYDSFEILEIYADDIVYAIAQIMQKNDTNETNESFNKFLEQNNIEYDFKCPLFEGPCLIPYSEILNAGYDIGDCTGNLADGLNNVDFRNNRIYTKNHFMTGYYKDGILIQKYGCHFDETDLHIFSLEDVIGFRPGTSEDGEYGGENTSLDIDSEGVYFFESIDFIVSAFIGKVNNDDNYYKDFKVDNIYIETDASNSYYLKDIASSITSDEYSNNDGLLCQNKPQKLKKLKSEINLKDKIEQQKKIAQRSRILRPILNYKIIPKNKFEDENDIANNKIQNNKFTLMTDSYIYYFFIDHFIEVFKELLPLYQFKDMFAIPINKKEMLEIKVENKKIAQTTKSTSKFRKMEEDKVKEEFGVKSADEVLSLITERDLKNLKNRADFYQYSEFVPGFIEQTFSILNNYKRNNLKYFSGNKNINIENFEFEILRIKEKENKVIVRITDGRENVYYAEVDIKISIKPELNIKTVKIDKNIINEDNKTEDKKELLSLMSLTEVKFKKTLYEELKETKEIVVEFPPLKTDSINEKNNEKNIQSLVLYKEQLTQDLINWAKNNNVKLLIIENKPLNLRRGRRIMGTNIRYIGKNGYIFIFSKEGISEPNTFNDQIEHSTDKELFGNIEVVYEYNKENGVITTDSGQEYNITINDNLDVSTIKENSSQTDLIKDLLSAA